MKTITSDLPSLDYTSISWSAILAGVSISLIFSALFNLIGVGLGFITVQVDMDTVQSLGIMAIVWLAITGIVSMFLGGFCTGIFCRYKPGLHGLVGWSISAIIILFLAFSTIGAIFSGMGGVLRETMSAITSAGGNLLQNAPQLSQNITNMAPDYFKTIARQTEKTLQNEGVNLRGKTSNADNNAEATRNDNELTQKRPQSDNKGLIKVVTNYLQADNANKQEARDQAISFLAQNTDMSQQQAAQTIVGWEQKYEKYRGAFENQLQETKQKAKQSAEKASTFLGNLALIIAFQFLLSAIAGYFGSTTSFKKLRKS